MAAPTFVAAGPAAQATSSPFNVTYPAGVQAGDVAVCYFGANSSEGLGITFPVGWTAQALTGAGNPYNARMAHRVCDGSESSTTISVSGGRESNPRLAFIAVFRGVDGTTPVEGFASATGSDSSANSPATTTTGVDRLLLRAYGMKDNGGLGSAPSGWTQRVGYTWSSGDGIQWYLDTIEQATAATVASTVRNNSGGSAEHVVFGIALVPGSGDPDPIEGTASITEAADTVSSAGVLPIVGALAATEAGDTVTASAKVAIAGTAGLTEADDAVSATGEAVVAPLEGTASITEADDTLAASAALAIAATAGLSEAGDTVVSAGTLPLKASASLTEADDTVSSASALAVAGSAALEEAGDTLSAESVIVAEGSGTLAVTEDDDMLVATGELVAVDTPARFTSSGRGTSYRRQTLSRERRETERLAKAQEKQARKLAARATETIATQGLLQSIAAPAPTVQRAIVQVSREMVAAEPLWDWQTAYDASVRELVRRVQLEMIRLEIEDEELFLVLAA